MFYNVRDKFGRFSSKPAAKRAFKKVAQKIKKDNVKFDSMTDAQKRVQICKDVIKWLDSGKLKAQSGIYCSINKGLSKVKANDELRPLILEGSIPQCNVCAKGAMFMSCVLKDNHLNKSEYVKVFKNGRNTQSTISERLPEFTQKQLDLIESYFEGALLGLCEESQDYLDRTENPFDLDLELLGEFKDNFTADERLRLIMRNIISNNGSFRHKKLDKVIEEVIKIKEEEEEELLSTVE